MPRGMRGGAPQILLGALLLLFTGCVVYTRPPRREYVVVHNDQPTTQTTVVETPAPPPPAPAPVPEPTPAPPPAPDPTPAPEAAPQGQTTRVVEVVPQEDSPPTATEPAAQPTVVVSVESAPPAPQEETIVIAQRPSPTHVWIYGRWEWRNRWVWHRGYWTAGRAGYSWRTGHWEARSGRFFWVEGQWVAEAQVTEEVPGVVVANVAPPAPLHETVVLELRPSPRHVWIYGHWAWHGHWVWEHGHWHLGRAGFAWRKGHWEARAGAWHWVAGAWIAEAQVVEETPGELVATVAPPAPYQETILIETRPGPNYTWIHGHWSWHGHWVWEHGHWHVNRPGNLWVNGHWEARAGRWHWVEGSWVVEANVTEERPGLLDCSTAPPAAIQETAIIELRPAPSYVWLGGHWAWHGHWVWVHGHWHPGHAHQVWRPGRWERHGGGFRWSVGIWVKG